LSFARVANSLCVVLRLSFPGLALPATSRLKMAALPRGGFSLIELLVVIAIIGILASLGLVAYQTYITSTRDDVGIATANEVVNLLRVDHAAITADISSRSELTRNLDKTALCRDQADQIVFQLNSGQGKTNTHNDACPFAFNGNRAWDPAHHLDTANNANFFAQCPPVVASSTIDVPRGSLMVACVNSTAAIESSQYRLYTCFCGEEDTCTTTDVGTDCAAPPYLGYGSEDACRVNWSSHPGNNRKCASPGAFN